MQILVEICMNSPILQLSFINILESSAVKTIKDKVKIIVIITKNNIRMHIVWNCQITKTKENEYKNLQDLSKKFLKILQKVSLDFRCRKI